MSFSRSAWLKGLEEDDESDDEILDEEVHDRPDAIMYLVEVSPSMHEAVQVEEDQPDGTTSTRYISNLSTSLKSCLDLMKARIISGSSRDVIGFLLYNTVNTKYIEGELPKTGLYLLLEPQTIRAHNIKMISDLVEEAETDPKAFQKRFQPIDTDVKPSHIVDGMKMSESLLRYRSSNLSNRSLFLITDNDDPLQGNKQQQSVALVFANDAHESGFQIKTFFMPADGSHFDLSLFWNRFRFDPSLDVEMDNASLVFSGPERFDKLLSLSSESGKTKRAQFTIPFYLFEGIALSVTGYATISEQKKKLPVTIEQAEEIKQVYFKTLYTQIDTGEVLKDPKKEIVKYMRIGEKDQNEQRIFFEDDEISRIKTLGMTPCMCFTGYGDIRHSVLMPLTASALKLLGFAPKSQLKPEYTIKHAYQIYPNETQFANSIPAFSALLKSMLKKDIIGLGVLIPRTNSTPQIVYLLPQAEVRDEETDVQIDPPCIWVIQAPYADDIRYPTVDECQSAVDAEGDENPLVDNFKKLIKKMRVQYSPHQFPNPVLQYHYNILAALALQEDTPSPDDTTLPDVQAIVSRAGPMIKSINETLNNDERYTNIKWRRSTTANVIDRTTRSATAGAGGNDDDNEEEDRKPKKIKVSNEKASISINELEKTLVKAFNGGEKGLKKITNDILKDYLKQKSQKISGLRKAELLALTRDQLVKDGKMEADD